jgi:hypothetical protein
VGDRRWSSLPLPAPFPRRSNPYNGYAVAPPPQRGRPRCFLSPCDSPWPTAAGRASSPWLRPRERSPSGGRVFRARCRRDPRGRPPPPLPLRFRYTSLDARSRNLKAKPQALNLKKSPPPAVRARPIPKPKPRGLTRRLHLRLRLVSEASPCVRSTSPVAAVAGRASPSP